MVDEMNQARNHVPDAPSVAMVPASPFPPTIAASFPGYSQSPGEKFPAGIMMLTLTSKSPIMAQPDRLEELLAGLRGFISYHIHANKMYLHTRVLKRIKDLEKSLGFARYDPEQMDFFKAK